MYKYLVFYKRLHIIYPHVQFKIPTNILTCVLPSVIVLSETTAVYFYVKNKKGQQIMNILYNYAFLVKKYFKKMLRTYQFLFSKSPYFINQIYCSYYLLRCITKQLYKIILQMFKCLGTIYKNICLQLKGN